MAKIPLSPLRSLWGFWLTRKRIATGSNFAPQLSDPSACGFASTDSKGECLNYKLKKRAVFCHIVFILAQNQTGQRYNPFSSSESVVSRAEAILLSVRNPGSRAPRSRSEMWTSWTPDCSARSICRQFRARRNFLIRSPVAAQMSLAICPSSD